MRRGWECPPSEVRKRLALESILEPLVVILSDPPMFDAAVDNEAEEFEGHTADDREAGMTGYGKAMDDSTEYAVGPEVSDDGTNSWETVDYSDSPVRDSESWIETVERDDEYEAEYGDYCEEESEKLFSNDPGSQMDIDDGGVFLPMSMFDYPEEEVHFSDHGYTEHQQEEDTDETYELDMITTQYGQMGVNKTTIENKEGPWGSDTCSECDQPVWENGSTSNMTNADSTSSKLPAASVAGPDAQDTGATEPACIVETTKPLTLEDMAGSWWDEVLEAMEIGFEEAEAVFQKAASAGFKDIEVGPALAKAKSAPRKRRPKKPEKPRKGPANRNPDCTDPEKDFFDVCWSILNETGLVGEYMRDRMLVSVSSQI
ncbi:hypothetical protein BO85DRAFT_409087 [Aspergillus piperis CBS 112811]|uniref:Uncharacterized protein n=1 Tax=Aspergillus piperis CBS 112811 TaxID=1448313 RepID=A0A8G1QTC6_9EURO|nr:hypothetical protein BO85DRAFT_409087 [Aspergillus piperis CBS 112811]RAH51915.1 hypothetical protein BO85DRAFT_409087 [Aspergillus piperis CBS 112811]